MEFTSTLAMRRNEYVGVVTTVERKETYRKKAPTLYNVKTYITPKLVSDGLCRLFLRVINVRRTTRI